MRRHQVDPDWYPEPSDMAITPYDPDRIYERCPSCVEGYQYIGGDPDSGEVRCHDCFGWDLRGAGDCQAKAPLPADATRYLDEKQSGAWHREMYGPPIPG
jgi:hypothetical protein